MTTSARLLELLALLQWRREWSGPDLAARLGVTERTVRRDIDRLRGLGYPVDARRGSAGGYRLGVGAAMPPLLLDDEEAVAVAVGLRTAAQSGVAGVAETAVRALAKLETVLPSRVRHTLHGLTEAIVPPQVGGADVDVGVLLTLALAINDTRRLRVDYRRHDGEESRREVEPHRLVHSAGRWYLVARDVGPAQWRTFRVDRLTPRQPFGARFEPREPPDPDLGAWTADGVTTRAYPYRCRVDVHAPAAVVREVYGLSVAVVTPLDDDRCEVVMGSVSLDEAAAWLGHLRAELVVHEPPELRAALAALAGRLARAAAPPG
ncbi:YafY family transcriptional regulator [Actinotalea ferrariae]|uniref:helix-turn-helix transcriptional regulator n=1 Tax=Actinotalea ferrariae TaxID=1386098 RepID=UPI001C8B3C1D|nr:YafY family protein [Actinotalea ferrariae]MBX9246844.1 YafY family transcriptional regulator [Actinotalea ferrariae]